MFHKAPEQWLKAASANGSESRPHKSQYQTLQHPSCFCVGSCGFFGSFTPFRKAWEPCNGLWAWRKVWGMIFFFSFYIIFNTSKVHVNKIIIHSCTLFLLSFAVCFLCFEKLLHLCTLSGAAEADVRLPSTAAIYTVCFTDKFLSWPWLTVKSLHPLYVISAKWKTL